MPLYLSTPGLHTATALLLTGTNTIVSCSSKPSGPDLSAKSVTILIIYLYNQACFALMLTNMSTYAFKVHLKLMLALENLA